MRVEEESTSADKGQSGIRVAIKRCQYIISVIVKATFELFAIQSVACAFMFVSVALLILQTALRHTFGRSIARHYCTANSVFIGQHFVADHPRRLRGPLILRELSSVPNSIVSIEQPSHLICLLRRPCDRLLSRVQLTNLWWQCLVPWHACLA